MPRRLKRMSGSKGAGHSVGDKQLARQAAKEAKDADLAAGKITFTEFLRVNMRLAEDRILSFVCVFSTGYGTKWIPGATFFYQPEIRWETLLTQRRRWLNGTFASFLFFFNSQRARSRIDGGMFDMHKAGKNIRFVNALWSLQLMQLVLVLISPAVFGSALYIGLLDSAKRWPAGFGWAKHHLLGEIRVAEVWAAFYLFLYATWSIQSYYAPRGRMPEWQCRSIAIMGFLFIFPVYFAVWASIFTDGVDVIDGLVICSLLLPVFIALAQSATSAFLYVLYLPWFLFLIIFFLVFVPSYSFARLWDTTWGNRSTGKDSAINEKVEQTMKSRNLIFTISMVCMNIFLVWAFVEIFTFGYTTVLAFMFIVFCPMIVQLLCSIIFLFVVIPLRNLTARPDTDLRITIDPLSPLPSPSTSDASSTMETRSLASLTSLAVDHRDESVSNSASGEEHKLDERGVDIDNPILRGAGQVKFSKV